MKIRVSNFMLVFVMKEFDLEFPYALLPCSIISGELIVKYHVIKAVIAVDLL